MTQPDVSRAAERLLPLLFDPPYLIDRIVDGLDGMEPVENDLGLGLAVGGALDDGGAHVDADLRDGFGIAAMRGEVGGKLGDGAGIFALGDEGDPGLVDVDEQVT